MLSKKDIALLRGMFQEHEVRFDQKLDDLKVNLRDEIHSTEIRMINRLEKRLDEVKIEIIDGITDTLDAFVFPQILELQTDMVRVKNHLHMV